jgi:hypothetical protein
MIGSAIMIHGLHDYYENVMLRDMWKIADGHMQNLQLVPVKTGRGSIGREHPRFNATAIYAYRDDSGTQRSGTFQSAVSSEGRSHRPQLSRYLPHRTPITFHSSPDTTLFLCILFLG